jgi:hypothetical protein
MGQVFLMTYSAYFLSPYKAQWTSLLESTSTLTIVQNPHDHSENPDTHCANYGNHNVLECARWVQTILPVCKILTGPQFLTGILWGTMA